MKKTNCTFGNLEGTANCVKKTNCTFRNQDGTVNCLTVPFGIREVKCKIHGSNCPQNTSRKIYRVFAAVGSFYAPCSTGRHTCTIFLPTSRLDCHNFRNIFSLYFPQI